jgi:hypothetical protein
VLIKRVALVVAVAAVVALPACAKPSAHAAPPSSPSSTDPAYPSPSDSAVASSSAAPSSSAKASPSRKATPKAVTVYKKAVSAGADIPKGAAPKPTADGVPLSGAGTFSIATGGTDQVGTGTKLIKYRIELEDGIKWGGTPVWTPASFAQRVDTILGDPRGWTASAASPVTVADQPHVTAGSSWSFQRVSGTDFGVQIRLATPNTVDKLCGQNGVQTEGQYSCRFGHTLMINLRRWLHGVPGFGTDLAGYRNMVIDHEMGHFLGFDHMTCPGPGKAAPVMQTQTIDLGKCLPNPYPFAADGTFIVGPWASS